MKTWPAAWFLIFLLSLCHSLSLPTSAQQQHTRPTALFAPETLTAKQAARYAFSHWRQKTAPFMQTAWPRCNASVGPVHALLKHHRVYGKHHCLYRMHYSAAHQRFAVELGNQCYDPALRDTMIARANMSAHVFSWIQRKHRLLEPVDFYFYYDATTATRVHKPLFIDLGRPVITQSQAAHSAYTFPTVDTHMLSGLAQAGGWDVGMPSFLRGFAKGMSSVYSRNHTRHPWHNKQPKAVYAGSCFPTFGSSWSSGLLTPRADVCALYKSSPAADIKLSKGFPHNGDSFLYQHALACQPCHTGKRVTKDSLKAGYKYLLNIDGYGAPTDGTFWKLASSSVVVWVLSHKDSNEPLWQHWYAPLLKPYHNYIPAHVPDVEDVVHWCRKHDQACELIARRCYDLANNVLTADTLEEYLKLLITYLQELSMPRQC